MQDIEEVVEESEETAAPEEAKEPDYGDSRRHRFLGGMDPLHTPFESHGENHKVSSLFGICR
jgi:hypothetical protein